MDKGTKTFLGWSGIVLGILVFILGFPLAAEMRVWGAYVLGLLVFIQGIWLLSSKA